MSGTDDLRAARESRADLARRAARGGLGDAMTRMVDAAIYRSTHRPPRAARQSPPPSTWGGLLTPEGVVRYLDTGAGDPVLFVHGIFDDPSTAVDRHGALVPAGVRVIAPARFGYAGSTLPAGATPAGQADAFAALLDDLHIACAAVVAMSSGATSALQFAVRHPERVSALVLVAPNGPGCQHDRPCLPRWLARTVWRSDWLTRFFRSRLVTGLARRTGRWLVLPPAGIGTDRLDGALFDTYVSDPAINGYDLTRVTAPTLIAYATDDTLVPAWGAVALAASIPGAERLVVSHSDDRPLGAYPEIAAAATTLLASTSD